MSSNPKDVLCPPLPRSAFVRGRVATNVDVMAGRAAFALDPAAGVDPKPLPVKIPQYAIHTDTETGKSTPGIVIQAEAAADAWIVGMKAVHDGGLLAGLADEFELLGVKPPSRK